MNSDFFYKFYSTTHEAWDAMFQAIGEAKFSIEWELYIFIDDAAGRRFVDILCEKASSGVEVRLVLDSLGSFGLSSAAVARLRQAGVLIAWFNPLRPEIRLTRWVRRLWQRNHRKILIIDEEVVFIGGVNIIARSTKWQDIHVLLRGGEVARPLVAEFQESFIHSGGLRNMFKRRRRRRFPRVSLSLARWSETMDFILHSPSRRPNRRQLWKRYVEALSTAQERFDLVTPYFIPDQEFMRLISEARSRGVVVNIIVPLRTDVTLMQYIAQPYLFMAERAGVNIYLSRTMNHGKAVCVDQAYGVVGSANLTPRSFYINEEAGVYFTDPEMVRDLRMIMDRWILEAVPFSNAGYYSVSLWQRWWCWWASWMKNYV